MARSVLIFHLGALGDFVLTWPLAIALGRLHPQSRIYYVTHAQKGALAEKALRIDSADIETGWHQLFSAGGQLPAPAARLLGDAHSIYSFISDGRDVWADNARAAAPQANLIALQGPTARTIGPAQAMHASSFLLQQLQMVPAVAAALGQILRSVADRGCGVSRTPDGCVVIHPGAGSGAKCWPIEYFFKLATRLRADGHRVCMILGETELERWSAAQRLTASKVAQVVTCTDLLELLGVLRQASFYIGNDSGPSHLAGIIGLPTLALFGPTDPAVWSPLGPAVTSLHQEPLETLTVDRVYACVNEQIACRRNSAPAKSPLLEP